MLTLTIMAWPTGETPGDPLLTVPDAGGTLGRAADSTLCLPDQQRLVSRTHARLFPQQEGWLIQDNSRNGLKINGMMLRKGGGGQRLLADGDLIALGGYQLLVSLPPDVETSAADQSQDTPYEYTGEPLPLMEASPVEVFPAAPPLLTDTVSRGAEISLSRDGGYGSMELLSSDPLGVISGGAGPVQSLSGIDALADEVLREFSPSHLQHKLGPWRGRRLRRQSWWTLYRNYHKQLERSGELHMRLREWFLRSGHARRDRI